MSASISDVVDQMRAALAVTDPDLDTSVGTTTRKMLDTFAESLAESFLDQHMLTYVYDVDSKTGADLDAFCQTVGGISRLAARRATGTLTFSRNGDTTSTVLIPVNTQVNSSTTPTVSVQTITGASMLPGQTSVTVAAQAVNPGPDGNLAAGALTLLASATEGVSTVTNTGPLSGGLNQETDSELRARWKATALRSNAGTEPMYLGLAVNDPDCTAARVIGGTKVYREQVQISGGSATSSVPDAAYVFSTGVAVGPNIDGGALLINGVDYTWNTSANPPQVVIASGVSTYDTGQVDASGNPVRANTEGAVLDLEFRYVPTSSRNDPTGTRFNAGAVASRVDVWVAGQRLVPAQQSVVFSSSTRFTGDSTSAYYTGKFARLDGTAPAANNVFVPLAFGPITAVPDSLSIGGATYGRVGAATAGITHPNAYQVVHDDSPFGYTGTSLFGLEWDAGSLPANGAVFTVGANNGYLYNQVPRSIQDQVERWRLGGVDAQVHAAKQVALRFSAAIVYLRGMDQSAINSAIDAAVADYLGKAGLGGQVQTSDIEQVIHNVAGVEQVRLTNWLDYPTWTSGTSNNFNLGIQRVAGGQVVQTYVNASGRPQDVVLADNQVPVLESVVKVVKAPNTFKYN